MKKKDFLKIMFCSVFGGGILSLLNKMNVKASVIDNISQCDNNNMIAQLGGVLSDGTDDFTGIKIDAISYDKVNQTLLLREHDTGIIIPLGAEFYRNLVKPSEIVLYDDGNYNDDYPMANIVWYDSGTYRGSADISEGAHSVVLATSCPTGVNGSSYADVMKITSQKVDLSGYNKIQVAYNFSYSMPYGSTTWLRTNDVRIYSAYPASVGSVAIRSQSLGTATTSGIAELDISDIDGEFYIAIETYGRGDAYHNLPAASTLSVSTIKIMK